MSHWLVIFAFITVYMFPGVIAAMRGHGSKYAITFVNLIFGWTVIGWIIAMIWALTNKGQNITIINQVAK